MILKMRIDKCLICIFIYCLSTHNFVSSQFKEKGLCDNKCVCLSSDSLIACSEADKIAGIPTNVERVYQRLMIQHGSFEKPILYRHNLTDLHHLIYLKIVYCKLEAVEVRAFQDMRELKYLDLSHNKLRRVDPYTFSGLSLNELHLMENLGIQLSRDSLKGMTAESINLRSNDIKFIEYETFMNTRFTSLYFYNNRITTLDQKFADLFSRTNSIIDLTGNPLDCTCSMRWIVPLLKKKYIHPQIKEMKSVNFTCSSPMKLLGKEMKFLSPTNMSCPKPKITSITVALGIPLTELTCTAVGHNYRAPGVSWNFIEPNNVRELRRTPMIRSSNTTENLQTFLSVSVKITDQFQAFTCTSWLDDDEKENIVVNIKAPPQQIQRTTDVTTNLSHNTDSSSNNIFRPIPEPHFIFKKQFTILEMIGAVVGTFTITLILLVMLAQILRWWRRGQKQEANYKSVNIIKPYWTLGHDSNNTYSQPISHTEYDVPRIYDSHPPSMCQSPPLSRGEFLDYKTQNKIYST